MKPKKKEKRPIKVTRDPQREAIALALGQLRLLVAAKSVRRASTALAKAIEALENA